MQDADEPRPSPASVTAAWQARRAALRGGDDGLPAPDADLAPYFARLLPADQPKPEPRPGQGGHRRKTAELAHAFAGQPEALALNALLIAHLRKRSAPERTAHLFQRLWAEHGPDLCSALDARWKVSSLATFGDHGVTAAQRSAGLSIAVLFNTMKLYEWERLHTGQPAHKAHSIRTRPDGPLPMEMAPYSLGWGGLDQNLLARLWEEAGCDPVIAPLAQGLLAALMEDERGIFHRLRIMRMRKARADLKAGPPRSADATDPGAPDPDAPDAAAPGTPEPRILRDGRALVPPPPAADPPSWGVFCALPADADVAQAARHAAWHLALGAAQVTLACADAAIARALPDHPRLRIADGDEVALARAMSDAGVDWLAILPVDGLLLPHRPVAETLALVPQDAPWLTLPEARALGPSGAAIRRFDATGTSRAAFARTALPGTRWTGDGLSFGGRVVARAAELPALPLGRMTPADPDTIATRVALAGRGTLFSRGVDLDAAMAAIFGAPG